MYKNKRLPDKEFTHMHCTVVASAMMRHRIIYFLGVMQLAIKCNIFEFAISPAITPFAIQFVIHYIVGSPIFGE